MLHHALTTQAGLRTFYGPAAVPEFGESPEPLDFTSSHFFQTLMRLKDTHSLQQSVPVSLLYTNEFADWLSQESLPRPRKLAHSPGWKWLRPGRAEGRLYGGCLPSLVQLCGTKYMPDHTGRILLVETPEGDKPGTSFSLDSARSALADLRNAGVLDAIVGMVIGRPYMYDEHATAAFEKIILDQCYHTTFPILANVDTGHGDPMLTLTLDTLVWLDSSSKKDGQFVILEAMVSFQ